MPGRFRSSATGRRGRRSSHRRSSAGSSGSIGAPPDGGPAIWRAPAPRPGTLSDADELKFDVQRLAVEGFHHIFVSASLKRGANVRHVVFGGAENDLGLIAVAALTKHPQELHPAHYRHIP